MRDLRGELASVIARKNADWKVESLENVSDETDIFDAIDSYATLELLLETEEVVERFAGRYVSIGDEKIFDAQHSPLRKFSSWVAHVDRAIGEVPAHG